MGAKIDASSASRSERRAHRSYLARRRSGRAAALLCLVGLALAVPSLFFVGVGGAAGSVTVTPDTGLTDGATVTVAWTGRTPNFSPVIEQCNGAPTNPSTDCDFLTVTISETNASGAGADTFTVFAGLGPSRNFSCDNQNPCTIRVADDPNDLTTGAQAPITFSTIATTTSSTSSTSTSSTSSPSSTSSSSTTTTSNPGSTTTTSTTEPGSSTTTTTGPTSVLGTDTSNTGGGSGGDGLVLAFTGSALHVPFTLFAGVLLFVTGLGLRRFALAGA